ncbi:MAG: LysR family transcriptional regulator [Gemmatimonadaceae bacterium]
MNARSLNAINYQHLLYFWVVAREGSIARATGVLNLTQPTISTQLQSLQKSLNVQLFLRRGRMLVLTDVGEMVFRFADEMFRTGQELTEALAGKDAHRPARLVVGVSDALPKLTTWRLLSPALNLTPRPHLVCRIGKTERLIADLSVHALDVVLADAPAPATLAAQVYNHLLGQCGVTVFGTEKLAALYRRRFPQSLTGAPFIVQTENTQIRRSFEAWCIAENIKPDIVCEAEDVALLQVFGQEGMGLFLAPTVVEAQVRKQYGVRVVGRLPTVIERFYAISAERRLVHPGVVALSVAARTRMFG